MIEIHRFIWLADMEDKNMASYDDLRKTLDNDIYESTQQLSDRLDSISYWLELLVNELHEKNINDKYIIHDGLYSIIKSIQELKNEKE